MRYSDGAQFGEGPLFLKGHGTENDFVILPDPDGELKLTDSRVQALCDRRRGLGADGVLRVVRTAALEDAPDSVPGDVWFMDYRNADGSVAEMCGNGVRVFANYLVHAGLAEPGEIPVGTRAGVRPVVTRADGRVTVDMGPAALFGRSRTAVGKENFPGVAVDLGNPHLACVTEADLDGLDLSSQPPFDPQVFPKGVNIEFVQRTGPGRVRMRVYERGVGETRSCGTGTVAATVAALDADGATTGHRIVDVPGGTVEVEVTEQTSTLTGPAVLVAAGRLDALWWELA
ncbi:diaminopimelate epimerase [Saccharopolyspora erythraea NRRL 2338]|uniref:Diaminopimelate epimerase n=2 Tax=Saccharopolyspora erythraea TaxID=1836 RepID=A4FAJ6_SACEN|nr:diaminopimelate epimerase [Saccharopolyspora erythraea]EQD82795.1 diaminopimelate epimerase [Saccharopolyspora erythraea D]PFG94858.1 diaminopimelate epimerase [Saccharopolyspora erythraea NRRL 2338]CAM01071.1 diaminopimelate epimerase [Saccharopolyspora erythraea NRRL 2338]